MSGKYIFLLLWLGLMAPGTYAQQPAAANLMSGRVLNGEGQPVAGAIVQHAASPAKAFTDTNGHFSLFARPGDRLWVERSHGYRQEQAYTGDSLIIRLKAPTRQVPQGYGETQSLRENTSAIGLSPEGAFDRLTVIDPGNALYGLLPGLSVLQNAGEPNRRGPSLFLRGRGTLNNGAPLVLVDGFERPLSMLSLAEIETAVVLKDAAALARFGQRGANGVLLITTKRGLNQDFQVDVDYSRGFTQPFRLPQMANAAQYARAYNQALSLDGLAPRYPEEVIAYYENGNAPLLFPDVDWQAEALRDRGVQSTFSFAFKGGGEHSRYFVALNYQDELGLTGLANENTGYSTRLDFSRFNLRTNLDVDLTPTTLFQVNLAGNISQYHRPGVLPNDLFQSLYQTPANAFPVRTAEDYWGGNQLYDNPVAQIVGNGFATSHERGIFLDARIQQDLDVILPGLSAEAAIAVNNSAAYFDGKGKNYEYQEALPVLGPNGEIVDTLSTLFGQETELNFYTQMGPVNRSNGMWGKLNYEQELGGGDFSTTVMYSQDEFVGKGQYTTFRFRHFAGWASYELADQYLLDASVAYSGSNLLPNEERYGLFYSLSAGWLLSEADFMQQASGLDLLKLRASFGRTGNGYITQNLDVQGFFPGPGYFFTNNNNGFGGIRAGRLASNRVSYEAAHQGNLGLDLITAQKRLQGTLDLFYARRGNILVQQNTSGILGVTPPLLPNGIVDNYGAELSLSWSDQVGDFSYRLRGMGAFARNRIVEMEEIFRPASYLERTGLPIGSLFGLETDGFFEDQAEIDSSPLHQFSPVRVGDVKYVDQNQDGVVNEFDFVNLGPATGYPELYYALDVELSYKGFGLRMLWQGTGRQSILPRTANVFAPFRQGGNGNVSAYLIENSWTPERGDAATLPRLTTLDNANNYQPSDLWLRSAAYLKLRHAELSYTYRGPLAQRLKADHFRLYLRGFNLWSLDQVEVMDPEYIGTGYPTLRSFTAGLHVGF